VSPPKKTPDPFFRPGILLDTQATGAEIEISTRECGNRMMHLYKRWDTPQCMFGDVAVLGFIIVQCLDGAFTYLGVTIWGPGIEANPLVSSAVAAAGLGAGLALAKLVAMGFGILLHLCRAHNLVALLTAIYIAAAIIPWTALFLSQ
jgi:hypothetical protein